MIREAHFIILQARGNPKKFSIQRGQSLIIGRSEKACNIVVEDEMCSSQHCKIKFDINQIIIEDLDSKNGMFFNEKRVSSHKFELQDKIRIGSTTIFLNPKIMESDIKAKTVVLNKGYVGDNQDLSVGHTRTHHYGVDAKTRNLLNKKNLDKNRVRLSTKPHSERINKVLSSFAQVLDLLFSVVFFFVAIAVIIRIFPELIKIRDENTFIRFLLHENMMLYSGIAVFSSFIFHGIIRRLPGGKSLGEKLLKVRK